MVDTTATDPMLGTLLERRYRIGRRIARGGMATVYEATDTRLDRTVAVKVAHAGYADDEAFVSRFIREARSTARLSHPHVVGVFDQGDDDGTLFLAMEYLPGITLRDLIRDHAPLPPARALALLDPVLSALAAAHDAGMIHRDVKPENVLLGDDGRIKVADFGLARAVTTSSSTATGGVLLGTVSYVAPELVLDGSADARSDVYSAGVLLYELLTGRKPHQGETPIQVAYKHVHEDVPPPSRLVEGVPDYLDALVARATSRRREARPADAKVMLRQVRRVRHALEHGVLEDAELTEDLSPARRDDDEVTTAVPREVVAAVPVPGTTSQPAERTGDLSAEGPDADRGDDSAGRDAARPRRSRKRALGWVGLLLVLLLAAAAGVGGWYLSVGRYTQAPDLTGLTMTQARAQLRTSDLTLRPGSRSYSETVPAGDIIATDPSAGERVLREGTITAVVSKGKERYPVPPVVGTSEAEARNALTEGNLAVGEVDHRFSGRVGEGLVVSASHEQGASLRPGTPVDLVVSKGPRPIDVPDVVGLTRADARNTISELNLHAEVARRVHDSAPRGEVIEQRPADGTLFRGDTVRLVVSKGPPLVEVPSVFGRHRDDAVERLEAAGFSVDVQQAPGYVGFNLVSSQSPGGSDTAPRGSTVTIFLH